MKLRGPSDPLDSGKNLRIRARHQNVVPRIFFSQHRPNDLRDLRGRLPLAENRFGESLPQCAMMIQLGKSQILERQMLQPLDGFGRRKLSRLHLVQNFQKFLLIHSV